MAGSNDHSSLLDHTNLTINMGNRPLLGAEIFSEEMLINEEFSTPGATLSKEPQDEAGRFRSKYKTRNKQLEDNNLALSHEVTPFGQRGREHGAVDFPAEQAAAG